MNKILDSDGVPVITGEEVRQMERLGRKPGNVEGHHGPHGDTGGNGMSQIHTRVRSR